MRTFTIEVDQDVFAYLQSKAQPLVDTPSTVLRRELLGRQVSPATGPRSSSGRHVPGGSQVATHTPSLPSMPFGTPAALQQTLSVIQVVLGNGRPRSRATVDVANILGVAPQTVLDKYCRQLRLTADAFDRLLLEPDLKQIEALLLAKYSEHADTIRRFFQAHRSVE